MRFSWRAAIVSVSLVGAVSCDAPPDPTDRAAATESVGSTDEAIGAAFPPSGPTTTDTPIGLAFEIDNGVGTPLEVRKGQRFYVNQIDMRASLDASVDEGVSGLDASGDFRGLDWRGTSLADQSFVDAANADGTFTRRRFYRSSRWIEEPSFFVIEQVDSAGHDTSLPVIVGTGLEHQRLPWDNFFVRRLRSIQWTYDCPTSTDCSGATHFGEEALVELRNAMFPGPTFKMRPETVGLRVTWSANPTKRYSIPVHQVENPNWDYGFDMDLVAVTPPGPGGTYAPGQSVTFQFTLKDGSGKRLHDPGSMPSYSDFLSGNVPSGIQYWRGPVEPFATYYRRKHREKQLLLAVMGPRQDDKPIYEVVDILQKIDFATGIVTSGTPAADGIYAAATGVPSFLVLFAGPPLWSLPSTDTWTFTLPPDAVPGTYTVALKGRRSYLGEDIPRSRVIRIQVGTTQPTEATLDTGHCNDCHQGGSALSRVNHALDDRAACTACHAPLTFEREGPIFVRTHFIHSRSKRFGADLSDCSTCHLTAASIQRTSKAGCLSCHKSYPADHVQQFGPVTDMYVGGGDESFQACSTSCHTTHPNSGL